jgi:hypothetical protein
MRHDHDSGQNQPRGAHDRREGDQEKGPHNDPSRGRRPERNPRSRQNNYAQDRWPDFDENSRTYGVHDRPEHLRGRRDYEESFNPARYQFGEQDPRYYNEENRRRREQIWEEQEREARHRERQNQYSSDRWPEQEEYLSRDTDNGQHPSRRRYYDDEGQRHNENQGR